MNTACLRRGGLVMLAGLSVLAPIAALAQSGCALIIGLGDPPDAGSGMDGPSVDPLLPHTPLCIAEGQDHPRAIAVAAEVVYWANEGDQTLWRADLRDNGKPTSMLMEPMQGSINNLAIDIANVYWSAIPSNSDCGGVASLGRVSRMAKDELPNLIWNSQDSCHRLASVFVDGTNLYWSTSRYERKVYQMPKGQVFGAPKTITASAMPLSIWVDSTDAYWLEQRYTSNSMTYAGGVKTTRNVMFTSSNVRQLENDDDGVQITGDATNIYWATTSGKVRKRQKVGIAGAVALIGGGGAISSLSVDARHVYYTVPTDGAIRRVPVNGGEIELVAPPQDDPQRVVVDEKRVYWTSFAGGKVCLMAKP
jgi:hypothetical protein